jgi:hypothetical protein
MKLKRFEAFLGDKFVAWVETPDLSISQTGRTVKIASTHEGTEYVTVLNLDVLPAYTVAKV